jgi:hypothetical protein
MTYKFKASLYPYCSWASASRKLSPVLAFRHLVCYRSKKLPDCVSLVRYRTCSGIVSFFHSGPGLTGCWTVQYSGISMYGICTWTLTWTWKCSMDMDIQHGHGHAARIWSCNLDLQLTCIDAGMPIKSSVWHH